MRIHDYTNLSISFARDLVDEITAAASIAGMSRSHMIANAVELYLRALRYEPERLRDLENAYDLRQSPRCRPHKGGDDTCPSI